jgi:flagellar export protein FliJ
VKSVTTLLRVKQREMDVLKRQQAVLENQKSEVIARIDRLAQQLLDEMKSAAAMPEMAHFFGDFSATIKKRQTQMRGQVAKLDTELDRVAVQILERFSEMKKYELALANWKKRRDEEAARRAQQYMDEIAIRGYIRKDAT